MERLVTEGILDSLDFSDLNICVECIKEKQTKHKGLGANRSSGILELNIRISVDYSLWILGMVNDTLYS